MVGPTGDDLEARRQHALRSYGLLDERHPSRAEIRSLVALAAAASGVPMAVINLFTEDEQHQVEAVGFTGGVSPRAESMCAVVVDEPEPVVLADASQDARFRDSTWVTGPASVRFYATFQLVTPAKVPIGSLCLFDTAPRQLADQHRVVLSLLAARVTDVLELELQSRRWRASARALEVANARLVDFAATVSHDLRGPLSTVQMALGMLEEQEAARAGDDPGEAFGSRDLLNRARRSAERMSTTIGHLLAEPRPADLDDLRPTSWLRVAADAVEDLGQDLDVLDVRLDPTDALVCCRPVALRLTLQNLLANAARYAGPTDPSIEVRWHQAEGHSEISVVDHGPGVPVEDRHRIFAPRQRGGTQDDGGRGLGLATAHRLVTEMDGRLELRDTPGGGATFVVSLPDA
ncbi:HAMP domain-containing sensor histidine kinase [uncultured Nocardioides sp.]|uniref:sensor histidine kinase n=1 Tax=uncultured Nocardioides sp. TaxID=198441 RepID=UPI00260FA911|nr:HAMP domain-containing sensor histidine kinase [uncultured Nocardioides sp.]